MTRDLVCCLIGVALGAAAWMLVFQGIIKFLTARQERRARRFLGQRWLDKHARFPEE
jgi:hypothetical protein